MQPDGTLSVHVHMNKIDVGSLRHQRCHREVEISKGSGEVFNEKNPLVHSVAFGPCFVFVGYMLIPPPPPPDVDPLDLSFWSFLTSLHCGIEEVERHLL